MSDFKYLALVEQFKNDIRHGKYKRGERLPSEPLLSQQTGFSRQTVRKAFDILEEEEVIYRMRGCGTFVSNEEKYPIPSHNIGVITTYIDDYIFPSILKGVTEVLSRHGYVPMLSQTENRIDLERKVLKSYLEKSIDGLIVEGTKTGLDNPNIDLYRKFQKKGVPIVFINGYYPSLENSVYIVADDEGGGKKACEILLEKGHINIAGIFKIDDMQGQKRYRGYVKALAEAGLEVNDDHVLWYTTQTKDKLLEECAQRVLSSCTGLVAYNDEVVSYLVSNVEMDNKLEIVSFDKSLIARKSCKAFISLANPKEEIGIVAARKIVSLIKGKSEKSVILPWGEGLRGTDDE